MGSVYLVSLIFVGLSMLVSSVLRSRFAKYNNVRLAAGLTGKEIAEKMLRQNGIYDVKVISVEGALTDHYNPVSKTVNLSEEVYNGTSIAAAAVASHECGHAVQHANAYPWLTMRSKLVPAVQFSSMAVQWILLAGILLIKVFPMLLLAGIVLFAMTTIFSIITLPVEFDASRRALAWLETTGVANAQEYPLAKDALKWAALTYVVAALSSIAMLVYYIMMYSSRSRD